MASDFDDSAPSEAALPDLDWDEEDAATDLQQPGKVAVTPMLERALQAAKALPEPEQDALAAAMLEWIEDERRWAESFARTHEGLAELAGEARAEHHISQTLDAAYAELAMDESREAESMEWTNALSADAADEPDEPRPAAGE